MVAKLLRLIAYYKADNTHMSAFDVSYAVWPVLPKKKILLLLDEIQSSLCIHVRWCSSAVGGSDFVCGQGCCCSSWLLGISDLPFRPTQSQRFSLHLLLITRE